MKRLWLELGALALVLGMRTAHAEDVKIGVIYPLTGSAAEVGLDDKAAMEVAADIINGNKNLPMLMGKGGGLSNLHGAKIQLIFADHQGDPQKARADAERLITQDHVAALTGTYQSATAVTVSQVAERYQVPFLSVDNSSPSLSERGLKWFFRTSPHDIMFTQAMFDCFHDIGQKTGHPVKSVAIIHEDSIFGSDSARVQKQMAEKAGIKVAADIRYRAGTPSLTTEVERLKGANADVVMPSSYTPDAILMVKTMHQLGYTPEAIMGQDAGFSDPTFVSAVGKLSDGVMTRSSYAPDAAKTRPAIPAVNAMFKAKTGKDLNDATSRALMGLIVLADAINRAGSTDPEAIRKALVATDIPGDQLIMPWKGVKFNDHGQNIEATPVILQVKDGVYHTIWPFDLASMAPIWNVGQ